MYVCNFGGISVDSHNNDHITDNGKKDIDLSKYLVFEFCI